MSRIVLRAEGLQKTYYGKIDTPVLLGIDFEVAEGEFVAVMGQSGSGKSTLLNLLGLLDRPSGGRILIDGEDPEALDDDARAHLRSQVLGFVFQFHYLLDEFDCLDNATLPILIEKGRVPRPDRARVEGLLRRVGLTGELNKRPDEMSGGQNQRTAIVRALANEPRIVLADEPTGNLDAENGAEVFRLFRDLGRETGVAVIMVTHDDRLAAQADRVLAIEAGRIRAIPHELLPSRAAQALKPQTALP